MAEEWRISRGSKACAATGEAIEAGEPFYSALVEDGDGFRRRDFSAAAWPGVDKTSFFSYWKTKGWNPKDGDKAPVVDYQRLLSFFDDLAGAEEPHRRLFRYVVALMLSRRRILRLDAVEKKPDGDFLLLHDRRGPATVEVFAPEATTEHLRDVQDRLNKLFDLENED